MVFCNSQSSALFSSALGNSLVFTNKRSTEFLRLSDHKFSSAPSVPSLPCAQWAYIGHAGRIIAKVEHHKRLISLNLILWAQNRLPYSQHQSAIPGFC